MLYCVDVVYVRHRVVIIHPVIRFKVVFPPLGCWDDPRQCVRHNICFSWQVYNVEVEAT